MALLDLLQQQLGAGLADQIAGQIGASPQATGTAVSSVIPMLTAALAKNSQSGDGAQALLGALDRDHDGSILDDVAGFVGKGDTSIGEGILGHVLGAGQRNGMENAIARESGLDQQSVSKIMAMAAPLVLGFLGKQKQQSSGFNVTDLVGMLGGLQQEASQQQPQAMDLVGKLLDSNGDGSVADDLGKLGMNLLGGLLSGKR